MTRELLVIKSATGEVVKRVDITGFRREAVENAAAKLHEQINPEEYYIEESED